MAKIFTIITVLLYWVLPILGQSSDVRNQVIRGAIIDRTTGKGLANAYVELLNHVPSITARSSEDGSFELKNVPLGRQRIKVELSGYYESIQPELVVGGKQSIISIAMDEEISNDIATIEAKASKRKEIFRNIKSIAVDKMNTVSVWSFNVEDITKFVGSRGEQGRLISNFPGLFNINDAQSYIVSRGNSPYGIQWLVEGVPIENPHHFATMGNTGGSFPLLNNNILDKSDFVNGAMSAQYSNTYSGVFDVKMRKGNNRRHEFSTQLSIWGLEFVAEGPFKKNKASYAITLRAGILDLIVALQAAIRSNNLLSSSSIPRYYDLNFKVDIPTKRAGHFSIFGIGGFSNINYWAAGYDAKNIFSKRGIDSYVNAGTGLIGVKHQKNFNSTTSLTTTLSYLIESRRTYNDTLFTSYKEPYFDANHLRQRIGLSSVLNKKINSQFFLRGGARLYGHYFNVLEEYLQTGDRLMAYNGYQLLVSAFFQGQYKFSRRLTLTLGLQGMYWNLNKKSWALEPRFALEWYIGQRHKLSLGYGWHSKIQTFPIAFYAQKQNDGTYDNSNLELGPTRNHHLILAYDLYCAKYWNIRSNVYAQYTTDLAVQNIPSSVSSNNWGAENFYPQIAGLQNAGDAFSYGVELVVEKLLSSGYYGLLSGSYQRAFYRGSDQVWRNSAFDVQYIASTVMGKEFKIGKQKRNIIYGDVRFSVRGGLPYTPIDLEASKLAGREVLHTDQPFSERLGVYKRLDLRLGVRINNLKKRISHHVYIEVNNLANFQNDLSVRYDPINENIIRINHFGLLPNLFYQIYF